MLEQKLIQLQAKRTFEIRKKTTIITKEIEQIEMWADNNVTIINVDSTPQSRAVTKLLYI